MVRILHQGACARSGRARSRLPRGGVPRVHQRSIPLMRFVIHDVLTQRDEEERTEKTPENTSPRATHIALSGSGRIRIILEK